MYNRKAPGDYILTIIKLGVGSVEEWIVRFGLNFSKTIGWLLL